MSKRQWVLAGAVLLNIAFLVGVYFYRSAQNQSAKNLAAGADGIQFQPGLVVAGGPSQDSPNPAESRVAALRSQSKNNLKFIALALHNYLSVKNGFPAGAHPHPTLPVEERLSWITDVLPYLEQNEPFRSVDFTKAWNDPVHERLTKLDFGLLHTPILEDGPNREDRAKNTAGFTQYVGIAGVGEDAPLLPVADPRAGAFGYNDPRTLADFRDGTSNTLLVTEASDKFGPWIAAGPPTLRSLTRKPYINGPDGIGGPFPGGVHAAIADGSARFISEKIDPKILEALSTINGGEPIP
jgi:hypothetical protein